MNRFVLLSALFLLSVACTSAPLVGSVPAPTPAPLSEVGPEISDDPLPGTMTEPKVVLSTPIPSATPVPALSHNPRVSLLEPVGPTVAPSSTGVTEVVSLPPTSVVGSIPSGTEVPVPMPRPSLSVFDLSVELSVEGDKFFKAGRYAEALAKYKEAEEVYGQPNHWLQVDIARGYAYLGKFEQAIHHYSSALEVREGLEARSRRSNAYLNLSLCPEAIEDALVALELEPYVSYLALDYIRAHLVLAICFTRAGD